jgi:hypothetical protein
MFVYSATAELYVKSNFSILEMWDLESLVCQPGLLDSTDDRHICGA